MCDLTRTDRLAIALAVERLDADKIHKAMLELDWTWADTNGRVPLEWDILDKAEQLAVECMKSGGGLIATGGLEVRTGAAGTKTPRVEICFVLAKADGEV